MSVGKAWPQLITMAALQVCRHHPPLLNFLTLGNVRVIQMFVRSCQRPTVSFNACSIKYLFQTCYSILSILNNDTNHRLVYSM